MESASVLFILFGLGVAVASNMRRSPAWREAVLLLASLIFILLQVHSAIALLPFAGFLLLGYAGLVLIRRGGAASRAVCIVAVIAAFLWLKKYRFLPESAFVHFPYYTLGISYIFFRILHLLIEHGSTDGRQPIRLREYLTYTLNFTTFVSGPIQFYDEFARDQFAREPIALNVPIIATQFERIIRGFFKINVLALLLDMIHTDAMAQLAEPLPASLKAFAAFRLALVYPFFLYANFSGYIDIVIALARLLRLQLPENFDRPFSATSFLDFWNRWHITLSTWLKTYVYYPLLMALARRIPSPTAQQYVGVFCFFVTFFLVGVWHGQTSEFVVFGLLQGGGVAVNKLWQLLLTRLYGRAGYKALAANPVYTVFARGLTFSWFAFTLFYFWATWAQIDALLDALTVSGWILVWGAVWMTAALVLSAWERLRPLLLSSPEGGAPILLSRYARVVYSAVLLLGAFAILVLLGQPAPDIVYKAF